MNATSEKINKAEERLRKLKELRDDVSAALSAIDAHVGRHTEGYRILSKEADRLDRRIRLEQGRIGDMVNEFLAGKLTTEGRS